MFCTCKKLQYGISNEASEVQAFQIISGRNNTLGLDSAGLNTRKVNLKLSFIAKKNKNHSFFSLSNSTP